MVIAEVHMRLVLQASTALQHVGLLAGMFEFGWCVTSSYNAQAYYNSCRACNVNDNLLVGNHSAAAMLQLLHKVYYTPYNRRLVSVFPTPSCQPAATLNANLACRCPCSLHSPPTPKPLQDLHSLAQ
jgi:hypothetical protein